MKNIKRKILVCGGTGFIGYNLIKTCSKLGWSVTSVSKNIPDKNKRINGVKYKVIDLRNLRKFIHFNESYDYIVNTAGYVKNRIDVRYKYDHFRIVNSIYEYFKIKNIKAFLNIGTCAEYGGGRSPQNETLTCFPKTHYGKDKLKCTNFLLKVHKKYGFPSIIFRLYQAYGPHQEENRLIPIVAQACYQNKKFKCLDGNQKRDFIYIDDLIKAIIKALKNKKAVGHIFNIGSGEVITIKFLINFIKKYFNKGKPIFGAIKLRKDEKGLIYPNISKIFYTLKWKPKVFFQAGIRKTLRFYKNKYKDMN